MDSPGGGVGGVPEAFAALAAVRGRKPTVALSNPLMASAAYWLASAADQIVASPSALTGSVGVYHLHEDYSRAADAVGVTVSYIHAGK